MSKAVYQIIRKSGDSFDLYESGVLICAFGRSSFRSDLKAVGRGSNWIGSILRLLNKKYPLPARHSVRQKSDYLQAIGISGMIDHLKSKGFRVFRRQRVSDIEIIKHLEAQGYMVEGLVGDSYYATIENEISQEVTL